MYNNRMKKVSIGDDLSRKRPPESKKYANVKALTNTGKTITKAAMSWEELNLNVRYRKNEHFRRIRAETLVSLLQAEDDEDSPEVLLLDLRTSEEYDSCHVRGAVNFPKSMLSRAMNPFIPEILEFCNREPQKIIVLYDIKERQSVAAGNIFFEKGIDNVFVLSKGMNSLIQDKFLCENLLIGDVPLPVPSSRASSVASTRASSRAPSVMGTPRKQVGTPRALQPYDTKVKIKLLSSSLRKSKPSSWH
ncbi:rhodanese domain-containing protein [Chloropicon primus]|uniref:Rhodanese domain-containing protein n=2 Tax=Chloropicon primus TaxID=1764295 RepID=A0A5B8MUJ5_9CHLO|nr:hypothetical protein A3770_09p56500 [Chloropicon primus]UPR02346.1 rhodanese domain-containing protein [Chloropicon primus]|eukprot:QDZ23132.1 hypothetical protein A3770_09p56500 [Chloropicon primus]